MIFNVLQFYLAWWDEHKKSYASWIDFTYQEYEGDGEHGGARQRPSHLDNAAICYANQLAMTSEVEGTPIK